MVKILFVGDLHLSYRPPKSRIDDYFQSSLNKLDQIFEHADGCSYVIFLGDIFHLTGRDDNQVHFVNTLIRKFSSCRVPLYSIVGNHDIAKGSIDTLPDMPLFTLFRSGAVTRLESLDFMDVKYPYTIYGYDFNKSTHDVTSNSLYSTSIGTRYIGCFHHFLHGVDSVNNELYRSAGSEFVSSTEISKLPYHLCVLGHDHREYFYERDSEVTGKIRFVSPGSMMRITSHNHEINKTPCIYRFTFDNGSISHEKISLDVKSPELVYDTMITINKEVTMAVDDLSDSFSGVTFTRFNRDDFVSSIPGQVRGFMSPYIERAGI